MRNGQKRINHMLSVVAGSITDSTIWEKYNIDTLVNAANPTLMGSKQGVDGEIHKMFNQYFKQKYKKETFLAFKPNFKNTLNKNICAELETPDKFNLIRCKRGETVTTSGYGLCNKIIHVVGAKYDGNTNAYANPKRSDYCTSSCIHTLESCYFKIIEEIKEHSDIKVVGIPIISSGIYKFPFELAVKIAITSIGNALIEWKTQDKEAFEYAGIEHIVFFIYNENKNKEKEQFEVAQKLLNKYNYYFSLNQKVVFQTSKEAHYRYLKEIELNDENRGYFSIAKRIRYSLMYIRLLFLPFLFLKDFFGKESWQNRRKIVEKLAFTKAVLPLFFGFLLEWNTFLNLSAIITLPGQLRWWIGTLIIYCLLDTITYLLLLIILSDIQRPSANIIRSLIMLFVNYIEVGADLAFLYTICYKITFFEALEISFLGKEVTYTLPPLMDFILNFTSSGIKFFFTTLVFGYFFNHIKQRKFRS